MHICQKQGDKLTDILFNYFYHVLHLYYFQLFPQNKPLIISFKRHLAISSTYYHTKTKFTYVTKKTRTGKAMYHSLRPCLNHAFLCFFLGFTLLMAIHKNTPDSKS